MRFRDQVIMKSTTTLCDDQAVLRHIQNVSSSLSWSGIYVDEMLQAMRFVTYGRQAFKPSWSACILREMLADVVTTVQASGLLPPGVGMAVDVEEDLPRSSVALDSCVKRMLMALLQNACCHTHTGCIRVKFSAASRNRYETMLHVEVCDTGVGVRDDLRNHLFTKYFTKADSFGFGLYMIKEQTDALGGSCGWRPAVGEELLLGSGRRQRGPRMAVTGSVFWFAVPMDSSLMRLRPGQNLGAHWLWSARQSHVLENKEEAAADAHRQMMAVSGRRAVDALRQRCPQGASDRDTMERMAVAAVNAAGAVPLEDPSTVEMIGGGGRGRGRWPRQEPKPPMIMRPGSVAALLRRQGQDGAVGVRMGVLPDMRTFNATAPQRWRGHGAATRTDDGEGLVDVGSGGGARR